MTWRERIAAARERGFFTQADLSDARDYLTCAGGEQARCGRIFNFVELGHFHGSPAYDAQLWEAGSEFPSAVLCNDMKLAEALLDQIEDRALQLKREA